MDSDSKWPFNTHIRVARDISTGEVLGLEMHLLVRPEQLALIPEPHRTQARKILDAAREKAHDRP